MYTGLEDILWLAMLMKIYLTGSVVLHEECWDESLWTRAAGHDQWGGK